MTIGNAGHGNMHHFSLPLMQELRILVGLYGEYSLSTGSWEFPSRVATPDMPGSETEGISILFEHPINNTKEFQHLLAPSAM